MTENRGSDTGRILLIGGLGLGGGFLLYKIGQAFFGSNAQVYIDKKLALLEEMNTVIEAAFTAGTITDAGVQAYINEKEKLDKKYELLIEAAGQGWLDKLKSAMYTAMGLVVLTIGGWMGVQWLAWKLKQNPRPPGTPPGQPITYSCPVDHQEFTTQSALYAHIVQYHTATTDIQSMRQAEQVFKQQYVFIQGAIAVEAQLRDRVTVSSWENLTSAEVLTLAVAIVVISVFVAPALAPVLVPLIIW